MADETKDKRKFDELRLLYSACVAEIASFKQHQWQVTNYWLLLYAAIASLPKVAGTTLGKLEYVILHSALIVDLLAGWLILGLFERSIRTRRGRLTEIRKHFTETFRAAWRCGESESEVPDHPDSKVNLVWFFRPFSSSGSLPHGGCLFAVPP